MADEEDDEERVEYSYEGERRKGEEVEMTVTVEVDDKPRTRTGKVKLLGPREGQGKATYPNGDVYEGGWVRGAREGEGKYTYTSKGWTYEGGFRAGLRHGLGVMNYGGGVRYHGFWADGLKSGQGTMYYASKDIYTGEWRAGKKHGSGVYFFHETGGELDGEWEAGNCVTGSWVDKAGCAYTGRYENQLPTSDGEYAFRSGLKVKGYYKQTRTKDGTVALQWVQQDIIGPVG